MLKTSSKQNIGELDEEQVENYKVYTGSHSFKLQFYAIFERRLLKFIRCPVEIALIGQQVLSLVSGFLLFSALYNFGMVS